MRPIPAGNQGGETQVHLPRGRIQTIMETHTMKFSGKLVASAVLATAAMVSLPAMADPITWTTWGTATLGGAGSASGTAGAVTVSYTGEIDNLFNAYPSYTPAPTWVGGIVGNEPGNPDAATRQIIQLMGGNNQVNTITFSAPVLNPVVAIWSLGQGGNTSEFDFRLTPTLEAGGPSAEYAGSSIWVAGNNVYGTEGNGSVSFRGMVSSISFTNPVFENWYGFTVGVDAVPEPETLALLVLGALGVVALARRKAAR